jgi:type VI secretion system protein ImpB
MPESTQHKLDRIRPPRVQITYDVETRGSFVKMELPSSSGSWPTYPETLKIPTDPPCATASTSRSIATTSTTS